MESWKLFTGKVIGSMQSVCVLRNQIFLCVTYFWVNVSDVS